MVLRHYFSVRHQFVTDNGYRFIEEKKAVLCSMGQGYASVSESRCDQLIYKHCSYKLPQSVNAQKVSLSGAHLLVLGLWNQGLLT